MRMWLAGSVVCGMVAVAATASWVSFGMGLDAGRGAASAQFQADLAKRSAAQELAEKSLAGCRAASARFQADVAKWSAAQDFAAAWRRMLDGQHRQVLARPWTAATYGDLEYIEEEYRAIPGAIPPYPDIMIVMDACDGHQI